MYLTGGNRVTPKCQLLDKTVQCSVVGFLNDSDNILSRTHTNEGQKDRGQKGLTKGKKEIDALYQLCIRFRDLQEKSEGNSQLCVLSHQIYYPPTIILFPLF